MASATAIITDVLNDLNGRGGFDAWWEEIDHDVRADLITDLEEIVNEHLDGHQPEDRYNNTIEKVTVVRKGPEKRLFDAYGETEGGYKVRIPLTGVSYQEAFRENGNFGLHVHARRVAFEDVD